MSLLELQDVHAYYGNIHALMGVSLTVEKGEIVALIGANGAGKTTTLRAISGLLHPRKGKVLLEGKEVGHLAPHIVHKHGLGMVPEGRGIFPGLTVTENLEMGAYTRTDPAEIQQSMERAFASFPRLKERLNQLGGTLSGGEQQMLAMARAMMSRPILLLMDEPSMGLSPIMTEEIFRIIQEINSHGTSILLVEQNALMALQIAQRAYVLETGTIVLEGSAKELRESARVREAYLGH